MVGCPSGPSTLLVSALPRLLPPGPPQAGASVREVLGPLRSPAPLSSLTAPPSPTGGLQGPGGPASLLPWVASGLRGMWGAGHIRAGPQEAQPL